ncbi:MAG: putative oxidoreductase [Pseudonocardia sp.]|nr:putative oxidoreductase [Pseudonocardia sp.]MDT7616458.1 hypothetical protein [Pseudonocardiales bacterium]
MPQDPNPTAQQQDPPRHAAPCNPARATRWPTTSAGGCWRGRSRWSPAGDSGIGRALCVAFAKEGVDVDVNVHSFFRVTRAALPHLGAGSAVINTGSVNGLRGNRSLIDYSASKGTVTALTYSLAQALVDRGIRVNCVAPGPVWTPG